MEAHTKGDVEELQALQSEFFALNTKPENWALSQQLASEMVSEMRQTKCSMASGKKSKRIPLKIASATNTRKEDNFTFDSRAETNIGAAAGGEDMNALMQRLCENSNSGSTFSGTTGDTGGFSSGGGFSSDSGCGGFSSGDTGGCSSTNDYSSCDYNNDD